MPYSNISELPDSFKALPDEAKKIAVAVINSVLARGEKEESAFAQAWGAVKKSFKQDAEGKWVKLDEKMETMSLSGVEILAVGRWNGSPGPVEVTQGDLDEMVKAFNALTADPKLNYEPPVKLGHDEKQKILQSDGYPAAGWIGNIKKVGGKIVADLVDVPKKIGQIIEAKGYKKISAEFYKNYEIGGKVWPCVLKAVALLGADIPAVKSINDIIASYAEMKDAAGTPFVAVFNEEIPAPVAGDDKDKIKKESAIVEEKIRLLLGLDEKADALAAVKDLKERAEAITVSLAEAESAKAELTKIKTTLAEKERDDRVNKAISATKILPAQKDWAMKYALTDPAGFDTFVAAQPALVKLGEQGTAESGKVDSKYEPTKTEIELGEKLGVSKEKLIALKKSESSK